MARLKEQYKAEVAPALYKKFGYKSTMQIPKIDKVVVNVGCGEAKENAKVLEAVVRDLTTITGQKAIITKAHNVAFFDSLVINIRISDCISNFSSLHAFNDVFHIVFILFGICFWIKSNDR